MKIELPNKKVECLTVKELYNHLDRYIQQGKGDRLVMVPTVFEDGDFDYMTVEEITDNDQTETCVYLEMHSEEDELAIDKYFFNY